VLARDHELRTGQTYRQIPQPTQGSQVAVPGGANELLGPLSKLLEIHLDLLPRGLVSPASRKKTDAKQPTPMKAGTAVPADRRRPSTPPRLYLAFRDVARGMVDEPRPPATNPSSPTARRFSRPAASPSTAVTQSSRITRTQQSEPGLQTPLDLRCVRHRATTGFRLAGSVNGKTGAQARIVEADFTLAPYPIAQLVGDLPDPVSHTAPRPRRDGKGGDPYKRISPPEYFEKLAGIVVPRDGLVSCPAPEHEDRNPSCSVGATPETGWCCHSGSCGARGAIYDLASVLLGGAWGHELRGEAFKRARGYVADVFGELSEDHDGTASGRPGERSRR